MFSRDAMRRMIGLLGSWALFVLGLGLTSIALAGQWVNIQDSRKLQRYAVIEKLLSARVADRSAELQDAREHSASSRSLVRSKLATASRASFQTAIQNRIAAIPASGSPNDEYFVEMARTNGLNVVRLAPGLIVDAETGRAAPRTGGGVWDWLGRSAGSGRMLAVMNDTVVEIFKGARRELPPGALILAGGTLVIPPVGTPQRKFDKVPLNLPPPAAKVASVKLEEPKKPAKPLQVRGARLREKGSSIFGGRIDD